ANAKTCRATAIVGEVLAHVGAEACGKGERRTAFRKTFPLLPAFRHRAACQEGGWRKLEKVERLVQRGQCAAQCLPFQRRIEQAAEPVGRACTPQHEPAVETEKRKEAHKPALLAKGNYHALPFGEMPAPGKQPSGAVKRRGFRIAPPQVPPFLGR